MSAVCCYCGLSLKTRNVVKCNEKECLKSCHPDCMPQGKLQDNWFCSNHAEPSMRELLQEIRKVFEMNADMAKSIENCHDKIDECSNLIKKQDSKISECLNKIEELSTKCSNLEKENAVLKIAINKQEQHTRLNSVELHGIPEIKGENVIETIMYVSRALNVELNTNMIDCCYRLPAKQLKPNNSRSIFLKLISRIKKEEIMKAKKVRSTLTVQDIFKSDMNIPFQNRINPNEPVYVNESLTSANKVLFAKCAEFKKKNNVKFLWVKNGKILMRQKENSKVYVIEETENLNDVH
ncbi:unnamed protein product [Phaedon cochleariae]|uniref:FP protein C-terminal domain-containing protein n=1 Tax=Phaedon cochleariae TaxID=80249 RepID=A0A9P0GR59_PHACE|nr:unnamed protein product [Phaedon cochleariae]